MSSKNIVVSIKTQQGDFNLQMDGDIVDGIEHSLIDNFFKVMDGSSEAKQPPQKVEATPAQKTKVTPPSTNKVKATPVTPKETTKKDEAKEAVSDSLLQDLKNKMEGHSVEKKEKKEKEYEVLPLDEALKAEDEAKDIMPDGFNLTKGQIYLSDTDNIRLWDSLNGDGEEVLAYRCSYSCPTCNTEGYRFIPITNDYTTCHNCKTKMEIEEAGDLGTIIDGDYNVPIPNEEGCYFVAETLYGRDY